MVDLCRVGYIDPVFRLRAVLVRKAHLIGSVSVKALQIPLYQNGVSIGPKADPFTFLVLGAVVGDPLRQTENYKFPIISCI